MDTGFYLVRNKRLYRATEKNAVGSINSYIEDLGYSRSQIHLVLLFESPEIVYLGFEFLSRVPVFALARNSNGILKYSMVEKELAAIDWKNEYSFSSVEDGLQDGVEDQGLTFDFLREHVELEKIEEDTYKMPGYDLVLCFSQGKLVSITSSDWLKSEAKWLKDLNPGLVEKMLNEARLHHETDSGAHFEVNKQCECIQLIPNLHENEFLEKHRKPNGLVNFYNLMAVHYNRDISEKEFFLINKGRYSEIEPGRYVVQRFEYLFENDVLKNVYEI